VVRGLTLTKGVNGLLLYVVEYNFLFIILQSIKCHYKCTTYQDLISMQVFG